MLKIRTKFATHNKNSYKFSPSPTKFARISSKTQPRTCSPEVISAILLEKIFRELHSIRTSGLSRKKRIFSNSKNKNCQKYNFVIQQAYRGRPRVYFTRLSPLFCAFYPKSTIEHTCACTFLFPKTIIQTMNHGKVVLNDVILQPHEQKTVILLTKLGYDVELIPKSNKPGTKSPDIKIGKLYWEIKAPKGKGKYLIQKTLHRAARQSENVIVDLQRIKIHQSRCLPELEKHFYKTSRTLKRLKIITKSKKVIDFEK